MTDINCDKRQKEVTKEGEQHRCIEKKATETYLQIVDVPTCEGCPILAVKNKINCADKPKPVWADDLLSVVTTARDVAPGVSMSEEMSGYEQPCHYRWDSKCRITNRAINPDICKACDQETAAEMATLPKKLANYAGAIRRWIREGRPVRTDEEVEERLKICQGDPESEDPDKQQPCALYDADAHACNKCGCAVSTDKAPLGNKIRMKSEICPMGLWK